MIKALLLDADGVTIIGPPFSSQLKAEFGTSTQITSQFFLNEFQNCLIGKDDLKKLLKPKLKEWNWNRDVESLLDYWFKLEDKPNQKILELVKTVKANNIKVFLATNQEKYRLEYIKKNMKFNEIFDDIFCSCEIGTKKPAKEFFEAIIAKLKLEKHELLLIDDQLKNINGAEEFGINAEQYTTFEESITTLKKYSIL